MRGQAIALASKCRKRQVRIAASGAEPFTPIRNRHPGRSAGVCREARVKQEARGIAVWIGGPRHFGRGDD